MVKDNSDKKTPWTNIALSVPFLGICIAHFSFNYMFYNLLTMLPKYLKNVHGYKTSSTGLVSTLPYVFQWLCILMNGPFATWLQKFISPTFSRRMFNSISLVGPGVLMVSISSFKCDTDTIIIIICASLFLSGFAYAGVHNPNILDLAPNYAGVLFGITNTVANVAGFLAPQMAGYYIEGAEFSVNGWRYVWITSSVVCCLGGTLYALTASGNKQVVMIREYFIFGH